MLRSLSLTTALLILVAASLADALRPGTARVDASQLALGTDSLAVVVMNGSQARYTGLLTLRTTRLNQFGQRMILRSKTITGLDDRIISRDSFAVSAPTFEPLFRITEEGERRMFDGNAFYANSLDLLLAALPLEEEYTVQLALDTLGTTARVADVEVTGQEMVQTAAGETCEAWRVEVTRGQVQDLYWIGTTPRRLLQYASPADGVVISQLRGC
jgi:hypothetical protein